MGVIIFNERSSKDFGLEVETFPSYDVPERDYDIIHVPGRNGDIVIDNGTYKNVQRSYLVSVATYEKEFYKTMNPIAEWLHSAFGYVRLEDTYEPDFYRMAFYSGPINIANIFNEAGRAILTFECKPQRFYKSGDYPITFSSSGVLYNSTGFASYPTILVKIGSTATGSVTIGNYSFSVKAQTSGTILDITVNSELQDAYNGTTNMNSKIVMNGGKFPKLEPGANSILFTGCVSAVEVIPKWWTI